MFLLYHTSLNDHACLSSSMGYQEMCFPVICVISFPLKYVSVIPVISVTQSYDYSVELSGYLKHGWVTEYLMILCNLLLLFYFRFNSKESTS